MSLLKDTVYFVRLELTGRVYVIVRRVCLVIRSVGLVSSLARTTVMVTASTTSKIAGAWPPVRRRITPLMPIAVCRATPAAATAPDRRRPAVRRAGTLLSSTTSPTDTCRTPAYVSVANLFAISRWVLWSTVVKVADSSRGNLKARHRRHQMGWRIADYGLGNVLSSI